MQGFESSVVSYPNRGAGGRASWRGNSGAGIVKDFLLSFHTGLDGKLDLDALLVDPMMGSGTTLDVATQLGLRNVRGFDLHEGFDAARQDLLTALNGQRARSIFTHPPYYGAIRYSDKNNGGMWGENPHPADLSHVPFSPSGIADFDEMLQAIVQNIARATQPGGHYGLLVGNVKKDGRFYHMPSRVIMLAPDELQFEIIKQQHNVQSDNKRYGAQNFIPIRHETLLVFRRAEDSSIFALSAATLNRLEKFAKMTWRNVIVGAMRSGEATSPKELVERLESHPRAARTNSLYAKVRQTLREHPETFMQIARGKYALQSVAA